MIPMHKAMRLARLMQDLSQNKLAGRAGISQSYLLMLERGKSVPTVLIAEALAGALGFSLEEYLGLRPPAERSDMQEHEWELCWTCAQDISANVKLTEIPRPPCVSATHKCRLCGKRAVQWYLVEPPVRPKERNALK